MKSDFNPYQLIVYVDVDDTLVRSVGTKRIPMPEVVKHIRQLKEQGAILYCWSTGGAEYAQNSAIELGIENCFEAYLPKPNVYVDDQELCDWRRCFWISPSNCSSEDVEKYSKKVWGL